ncbi:MAG TPA: cobalamin-binding protein [Pyrinomonadaceae bacterium]|nr:cobalamin-binding protein [Pyrinomonadaceae bacterium]
MLIAPANRNYRLVVLTIALLLACSACVRQERAIHSASDTAGLRQVTDEAGRSIVVPQEISRFISLAPNVTEIVFAINAGERLVGNTTYCDYPEQARQVQKVGDTLHPSIERIIALRPELVLVSTASQLEAFTRQLEEHRIAVYVTDPRSLEDVFRSIAALGLLLNRNDSAQHLIDQLRARAAGVEAAVSSTKPVKVFYQLSAEPLYTAGRDSFVSDLIRRAGGESVTADVPGAWPKYSAESALAAQPEVIILPTGGSMGDTNGTLAAALQRTPAAMKGRVYKINDDHLSRPGPRSLDGLVELAHALHPEAFKQ